MNIQLFKNRNGLIILVCAIGVILIYSVDILKLGYRMTNWQEFGKTPVMVSQTQYFIADTPNVIGYKEPGGPNVSCATTVAFVKTDAGDTYRCCDTGEKISCLPGDFSSDIPAMDGACINSLRESFAIPAALEGTTDYHIYGSCSESAASELTVTQIDANGQILWKSLNVGNIMILSSALRCIVAPVLLALIAMIVVITVQRKPKEPMRKLW